MQLQKRFSIILALVTVLAIMLIAMPALQAEPQQGFVKGQILVKFKNNNTANETAKQNGLKIGLQVGDTGARVISVPAGKEQSFVDKLSKNPNVEYAETDNIVSALTNDTYFARQYALHNIGQYFTNTAGGLPISGGTDDADIDAPEAWVITRGIASIKIAILDSGIDLDHEDISNKVSPRANFTNNQNSNDDMYGHGTHVGGIVAAITDNNIGVAGVCPDCTLLSGKILDDNGYGSTSWTANGINWAVNNGAKVINMSIGSKTGSRTLEAAINNAFNKNVVLVAAAGNGASTAKYYPAAYNNVIGVAATNNKDQKASFSSYGAKWVSIAAPGENVYSTFPNHDFVLQTKYGRANNYDVANGTSMSSPVVAGVAGLVWATKPDATSAWVRNCVQSSADKIFGTGTYWANGRVNANNAVNCVK